MPGPELDLVPPQSQDPLHPHLHPPNIFPTQDANPKDLRKGRACQKNSGCGERWAV